MSGQYDKRLIWSSVLHLIICGFCNASVDFNSRCNGCILINAPIYVRMNIVFYIAKFSDVVLRRFV